MSRDQRRAAFRDFNIHIKSDTPQRQSSTFLDLADDKSEERLSDIVDLLCPRDAHGKGPFFSIFLLNHLTLYYIP